MSNAKKVNVGGDYVVQLEAGESGEAVLLVKFVGAWSGGTDPVPVKLSCADIADMLVRNGYDQYTNHADWRERNAR